jgi:hypothetical protein
MPDAVRMTVDEDSVAHFAGRSAYETDVSDVATDIAGDVKLTVVKR